MYDYNNRLQPVRIQIGTTSNSAAFSCRVYNYYSNVRNPTTCSIPSQEMGNDRIVRGKYDQDTANSSLNHTASFSYDPTHRLAGSVAKEKCHA